MKRTKFIAAALTLVASPFIATSQKNKNKSRGDKGFKIAAGEGRKHGHIQLKGVNANLLDVKVSGSDTDGDIAVFEQTSLSQGKGTPLHIHHHQDEIFYVLEGEYYFQAGNDKYKLVKGDSIFLPRKVAHAWTQISESGKMTVILQPAGKLENFFVTIAALDHEPTPGEMKKIFEDNDMEVVGPPLKID